MISKHLDGALFGTKTLTAGEIKRIRRKKTLSVYDCDDITNISSLSNLENLNLHVCCDLSPLASLPNLKTLRLYGDNLDLTGLGDLPTVETIVLDFDSLHDISPLVHLINVASVRIRRSHDSRPFSIARKRTDVDV